MHCDDVQNRRWRTDAMEQKDAETNKVMLGGDKKKKKRQAKGKGKGADRELKLKPCIERHTSRS